MQEFVCYGIEMAGKAGTGGPIMTRETRDLLDAVSLGDSERALRALDAGADVNATNKDGESPLTLCIQVGGIKRDVLAAALIAVGAHVNHRAPGGHTPLTLASLLGHADTVSRLLEAGADVDAQDDHGATALHQAVVNDRGEIVRTLLDHGASVWKRTNSGRTVIDSFARAESRLKNKDIRRRLEDSSTSRTGH
jgi:ankyrin repeat protein